MGHSQVSPKPEYSEKKYALNHSEMCFLEVLKILENHCDHSERVKCAIGTVKQTYAEVQHAIIADFSEGLSNSSPLLAPFNAETLEQSN